MTVFTPNLILAHDDFKRMKIDRILIAAFMLLITSFLLSGNIMGFSNVCTTTGWLVGLCIATFSSFIFFISSLFWNGVEAVKLCAVFGTEGFKEYLTQTIESASKMTEPVSIRVMHLSYKSIKHIEKTIATMQTFLEIFDVLTEFGDLAGQIEFLRGYTNSYGFKIKDLTKEIANAKQK